jgi:general secretion pathway protein K
VQSDTTPDPVQLQAFIQLLAMSGLETKWAGYIVDWIDGNIAPSIPDGAEDSVYMGQTPPYRTANRYITSASELLALPGFGRDRYLKLAPYVSALPFGTPVNVCTAPGLVLDAYLGHQDFSSDPDSLAKNRANASACFPTQKDYEAAFADPKLLAQVRPKIAQVSSYFRLTSFITIGSAEFNLYSLLYQDQNGGGAVRPILRSFTPD